MRPSSPCDPTDCPYFTVFPNGWTLMPVDDALTKAKSREKVPYIPVLISHYWSKLVKILKSLIVGHVSPIHTIDTVNMMTKLIDEGITDPSNPLLERDP